jgi:hypothetical protein
MPAIIDFIEAHNPGFLYMEMNLVAERLGSIISVLRLPVRASVWALREHQL